MGDVDKANFVALVAQMRAAFGAKDGLTVTIPTSYWYLQHFDLVGMQLHIDWFNLMAYDLHGTWDKLSKYVGPYVMAHTNLTEIDAALDLLWRAGVDSQRVVIGQGWYGRSFTLKDPTCGVANGVCQFSSGARPGPCSQASGILDYQEIASIIAANHLTPTWDKAAGVKSIRWDSNQSMTWPAGAASAGLMVWAMDQVDSTADNGFGGAPAAAGAHVTPSQQKDAADKSADLLAGLKCYASDCGGGCKPGTVEAAQFNGQPGQLSTNSRCGKKSYRSLCCDATTTMGTCRWRGYRGAGLACIKGCAEGETELTTNTNQHVDKHGDRDCHGGQQSFCCAGFRPTAARLEDDLKEAAKAFCRVAVPALLAPLELLEDLIPIIGEIADAIEIAATPAIIEGCVKSIEKAGKAEFKVFGKTQTLKLDEPKAKPDGVPRRPTADKDGEHEREVKRAPKPMHTVYTNTPRMQRLVNHSTVPRDYDWLDGQGYAMKIMFPKKIVVPQMCHSD
ncbi:hypothetical protein SBRCBS47491_003522 [Sporothrix bragantina]|uniref:chitinase n=1 Tax=Sporothrix bragantina TaxID=671064 RepID=A0ABP0BFU4_9PEZI